MLNNFLFKKTKNLIRFLSVIIFLFVSSVQASDLVSLVQDDNGWKMKVNGDDMYIKGVVWGYSPKNENYTYNLWGKGDEFVQKVLDYEFGLMKKAGVNAIRSFATIPPKWVTYIYETYGIMTAINPLMGRYGVSVDGVWIENTDYSNPRIREILKQEVLDTVRTYKDVPGVFMFALGNESNYGLSWKSFEIENLPIGEQNKAKAEYLYSLFAEIITEAKAIDPNHPFTIVNGDIQYLDLIAKYGKDWDLLGTNSYRGFGFTSMWEDVYKKYDKPIVFFEFGSDAFNAKDYVEDEASQAEYIKEQWHEMYRKSYDKGEQGNSLGGFVFEWRDEWWKYKQTENLDKHDTNASWSNGGYQNDYEPNENNMNEEWWGINRLGDVNADGIYEAEPRLAYDILSKIWQIDLYETSMPDIDNYIKDLDTLIVEAKKEYQISLKNRPLMSFKGARVVLDAIGKKVGSDSVEDDYGLMTFIDFELHPNRDFNADITFNLIQSAIDSNFKFRYGDRVNDEEDNDRAEVYSFKGVYKTDNFDIEGFYHVPRYHWGDEGDFFGLLRETTDMPGSDIWNDKPPRGIELVGKKSFDGLKILVGPEVYWGANEKFIAKYQFGENKQYSIMHSQDLSSGDSGSGNSNQDLDKSIQTTLQGKFNLSEDLKLRIGGIISNTDKVDDNFTYYKNGKIYQDTVSFRDTLGLKARLDLKYSSNIKSYLGLHYAGIVADSGAHIKDKGSELPFSEKGNKAEIMLGFDLSNNNYTISPRVLYRDNLINANPYIEATTTGGQVNRGLRPRSHKLDTLAVLGNREARAAEIYLTYDPTPGTYFYEWDNDVREDANVAYNLGLTYIDYRTTTDANSYYDNNFGEITFERGLDPAEVWLLKSRAVFNPSYNLRTVVRAEIGEQQATAKPPATPVLFKNLTTKIIYNNLNIYEIIYKKDMWGPYDFQKDLNEIYPEQLEISYTRLLEQGKSEDNSSKFGITLLTRTLDERSNNEYYQDGENTRMSEVHLFYEYAF